MAKSRHVLPGFGLTLGYTLVYLSIIVLIPFSALLLKTFTGGWEHFFQTVTDPRIVASYYVSFGISFAAALVNGVFGVIAAWVLARYEFPGRKILDAIVDLPFALPTAVAGIALTTIYARNGEIGSLLAPYGIKVAYTQWGVFIALTFIGLPFVVRTVQPVIQDLAIDVEEAAATLGANRWQTFTRVIFPALLPSILTGVMLAYGRAVGEFGSVVFISGNLPFKTEITPLLIIMKLDQYDYTGGAALGFVMLLASFVILFVSNGLQAWDHKRRGIA
ncbi:MAG TPA: sulfate ABC transporter permease subunit CysT [Terrimicrobiaceae bacterium]|nr:sulfate ABC transporter permease subunit CysT [Terrimicrobiaceae bacterium]